MAARDLLQAEGIAARVVSMPCWELFEEQTETIARRCSAPARSRSPSRRPCRMGWDRYIGAHGRFVGMHGFGASAPYKDVYKHFGITPEAVAEAAKAALAAAK